MSLFPPFAHLSTRPLLLLLFSGSAALGMSAAPPLTLDVALQRSAARNPSLTALRYEERSAAARVEQAGLSPNPTLAIELENIVGTGSRQGVRALEATMQASQTIERGSKRAKRVALADRTHAAARQRFAVEELALRTETAALFVDLLEAQRRRELVDVPRRLAEETLAALERRVQAGAASPAEVARARGSLAMAEAESLRATASWLTINARLAALWGERPDESLALAGKLTLPTSLPNRAQLLQRITDHPRLAWQRSLVESQRAALVLEQAQAIQDVSVAGGVRYLREGNDASWVAGVSIPLPVRQKNQGNIRAAREALTAAEFMSEAASHELQASFDALWHELTSAYDLAITLRDRALPASREAARHVRQAYDEGVLPLIDVLDAQRALVSVERELLAAEAGYAQALVRLDSLTDPSFGSITQLLAQP